MSTMCRNGKYVDKTEIRYNKCECAMSLTSIPQASPKCPQSPEGKKQQNKYNAAWGAEVFFMYAVKLSTSKVYRKVSTEL